MKIKSSIILGVSSLALSTQALAGAYVGAQMGYSYLTTKSDLKSTASTLVANINNTSVKPDGNGMSMGIFGGYSLPITILEIAGEGEIGFDTTQAKKNANVALSVGGAPATTTQNSTAIAPTITSGLSGIVKVSAFGPLKVYARAGLGFSSFKTRYIDSTATRRKKTQTALSFIPGAGVEMPIFGKLAARAEVRYEMFPNLKTKSLADVAATEITYKNMRVLSARVGVMMNT